MAVKSWRTRPAGKETVVHERHTETRAETVPQSILDRIEALERARSAADVRHIEQERIVQAVIQAADALLSRIESAEGRLEQHKGVINSSRAELLGIREAIAGVSEDADKKRAADAA